MSKLLFSHSYFYRFDPKQWATKQPYPPLGTITAAAQMREMGHEVALFDTCLVEDETGLLPRLETFQPNYLVLYDDGFNYLTKMCLTNMREAAFRMAQMAKARGIPVIVSSSDSTDHFEQYLDEGADYIILGEGEATLQELIDTLNSGTSSVDRVSGLAYRKAGKTVKTPKRPVLRDLDNLPMAAWDLVDVEPYRQIWIEGNGYFSLNVATTRGCPFKCNWCAKPIYGNRYNSRSPDHVLHEIAWLLENYQPDHFWMCDDIFGLKPQWVQQFRNKVNETDLRFRYKIQSRADLLVKEDTIDALGESGLHEVWIGAESGSQKILDAMDKGTKLEQIYEATRLLKKKGIRVCFFLQFGYLGENQEDIRKTIDMVLELMPDNIGISVSYPLPGTKFYEIVKEELSAKANWTDSDDLDMMFEGTYSSEYYKRLHRYVHKVYRRKQGLLAMKGILKPNNWSAPQLRSMLATAYYAPAALVDARKLERLAQVK